MKNKNICIVCNELKEPDDEGDICRFCEHLLNLDREHQRLKISKEAVSNYLKLKPKTGGKYGRQQKKEKARR